MQEGSEFRDVFNGELVALMSDQLYKQWASFDRKAFQSYITPNLAPLSLTERAKLICTGLHEYLPKKYPEALKILIGSFGPEIEGEENESAFQGFYYMPYGLYVSTYGTAEKHYDLSMYALYELTKRFTSEWPIRTFIQQYPERTLALLGRWANDQNVHVRRLVSEGTRTRLPWAQRLPEFQKDPQPVFQLLDQLKMSPERYVQRSIANNLNDIAKDHPDLVVRFLKKWKKIEEEGVQWIIGHALRSLVKQGDEEALELLGFPANPKLKLVDFKLDREKVNFGEGFTLEARLVSTGQGTQHLMIDYVVYFMKANGKQAPKVFKLSRKELPAEGELAIKKKHAIRPITTRKYYPGEHIVELQINGKIFGQERFELLMNS